MFFLMNNLNNQDNYNFDEDKRLYKTLLFRYDQVFNKKTFILGLSSVLEEGNKYSIIPRISFVNTDSGSNEWRNLSNQIGLVFFSRTYNKRCNTKNIW